MVMIPSKEFVHKENIKQLSNEKEQLNSKTGELNEKLRKSENKFNLIKAYHQNILDNVQSGILIFDKNLKLITSNSYFNRFLEGKSVNSPFRLFSMCLKIDKTSLHDELKEVIAKGKVWVLEKVEFNTPSGRLHKLKIRALPIMNEDNTIIGCNMIFEDITEKVELEEKLSISERLAAYGKLTGKAVHELNNLIDGILRFVNLAIRVSDENNTLKNYLLQSKNGMIKMIDIVSSLLNYSRSAYSPEEFIPVNDTIKYAVAFLEHKAVARKIKITLDMDKRVSNTKNRDLIQVFINIAKNSIDAMPDGGELKITSARKNGNNIISFTDIGVGIPLDIQHRIYDPFFTNKDIGMGIGLGLAICKDIITRNGGNIYFDSKEGKGTTFTITIPVEQ